MKPNLRIRKGGKQRLKLAITVLVTKPESNCLSKLVLKIKEIFAFKKVSRVERTKLMHWKARVFVRSIFFKN